MRQNINHVDHVLWICRPENQAGFARELSALCQAEFHGPVERPELGTRIFISWSAGVEIIAPIDPDNPFSRPLFDHLEKRGDGLLGIVFGVADIAPAREHALMLGRDVSGLIENADDEPYVDETPRMREVVVGEFMNSLFVYGEIEYADGVVASR